MASQPANQKRKRGRPSNASRNTEDASSKSQQQRILTKVGRLTATTHDMEESDLAEETRPRKRGRTARVTEADEADETTAPSQSRPTNKKRDRGEERHDKQKNPGSGTTRTERARPTRKGTKNAKELPGPAAEEADDENEDEGNSSLLRRSGRDRKPMGEWYKSPNKAGLQRASAEPEGSPEEASPKAARRKNQAKGDGTRRRRPAASAQANSEAEAEADGEAEGESGLQARTKKGRPKRQSPTTDGQDPTSRPKQRRMRSSLQHVQNADDQDDGKQQEAPSKSKRRGRPPPQLEDNEAVEASSSQHATKSRRRHQPRGQEEDTIPEERSAASKIHAQDESRTASNSNTKRKRKRPPTPGADASPEPEPEPERPPYQHIATHTRRVPRGVIDSKWAPLDPSSISSVTDLLVTASRPVLLRLNNPARRAQAAAALGAVSNRLRSKLSRGLPFPPPPPASGGTTRAGANNSDGAKGRGGGRSRPREDELEYERTVAGIRGLETALDPLLHSVELLRRERDRAQRELENEYRVLGTLKANARAQARERRGRGRKLHVLASANADHEGSDGDDDEDDGEDAGDVERSEGSTTTAKPGSGNLFADILDLNRREDGGGEGAELTALATQIADHMETMRGNLAQIDGIAPALAGGRAALVDVLATHLGRERLEDVLLGS